MRQSWQMWQSNITPEECDAIIDKIRTQEADQSAIFGNIEEKELRSSLTRWVDDPEIRNMMWWFAKESNRLAFGFDVADVGPIQFTEYRDDQKGKYDWHHDVEWISDSAFDRKISVVVQLSDGDYYEGGDFQFDEVQNPDPNVLRTKGTVICFPSYLRHRVTEVTKGTRYSLVAWFEGPRWR